jgi:hypothetical protein
VTDIGEAEGDRLPPGVAEDEQVVIQQPPALSRSGAAVPSRYSATAPAPGHCQSPLWASCKDTELANLAGDTLEEIIAAAGRGIQPIRVTPQLPFSSLRHCGPSLW